AHTSGRRYFYDHDGSTAILTVNQDGRVSILSGEGEVGQGNTTILAQIAAEELGVPFEDVEVSGADTDAAPFVLGAFGSRLAYVAGNAVRIAAAEAKQLLLDSASEFLGVPVDQLEIVAGRVQRKGTDSNTPSMTVAEISAKR